MSENIGAAQLAITADASGVEAGVSKAKKTLATLGGAAKAAGKDAAEGIDKIGKGGDQAAQKLDRATASMIGSIQRTTATMEAGSRSSSKYFEALAAQRGVSVDALKPYLAQLDAAGAKQKAATSAALATAPAIAQVGMSAKATAFALRGVPAQFTDIATSIAAGQNPMQVFLQQGGQLKDMFGGIGPAARALGGYMFGLLNPLTLAAAAVGVLGLAYFQGSKEGDNFAKAIILSGNAVGKSVGQLQQMAERIGDVTGTQHAAAAALAEVVQNGTLAGDSIERFTAIALKMERDTGQSVSETVKQFAELGKSPVEAATKLNEATNFLTASVAHQIKVLEDQGRTADAARVAQSAYADALETRLGSIESRLGTVERSWRAIVGAAKSAWDAMLNIGRPDTLEQQLAKVSAEIAKAQKPFDASPFGGNAEARAKLADNLALQASLQAQIAAQGKSAEQSAKDSAQAKARLAFDKAGDQFLTKRQRMEQEITKARNEGVAAGASQVEVEKRIANIREKYTDKGAARSAARLGRADLGLDIERIRGDSEKLVGIYTSSERRIDALRSAGLLSDNEYYEAKRAFINLESAAKEDALTQEIARYQQEKLTGADKLTNDKKIADAQAKLAILRANTSSKLEGLSDQQVQATKREAAEFLGARRAAEDYFNALQRRQDADLAGIGKGRQQRDINNGSFNIQERFRSQREQLETKKAQMEVTGTFTDDERRRYEERLSLLGEYEARELSSWTDFNQRKLAAETDWLNGAQEALKNYSDSTKNVAGDVEQVFTRAFSSLEDALAEFVQTGKFNFSSLVRSILADVARLSARKLTGSLADSVLGALGGGGSPPNPYAGGVGSTFASAIGSFFSGGRAIGGPVSAGGMYRVTERGTPELLNVGGKQFLMMGGQGGNVSPGGGDIHVVNNLPVPIGKVEQRTNANGDRVLLLQQAVEMVAAELNDAGSRVSKSMQRNFTVSRNR